MIRRRLSRLCLLAAGSILVLSATAHAARAPSLAERAAITKALPGSLRKVPAGCVWIDIRVSSTGGWASATPRWLIGLRTSDPCLRYASDGRYLLRRAAGKWQVVFQGSDLPACRLKVPRDLSSCRG
jgi:hypothetical protein